MRSETGARLIELVGPAGAGKSTVLRAMARRDSRVHAEIRVGSIGHAGALAPRALALLPLAIDLAFRAPRFLWENARHIARLEGLDAIISTGRPSTDTVVAFADGPLFLLTRLFLAAEEHGGTSAWFRRWESLVTRWTERFDLIVWLDAPDAVLASRIRARAKDHRVKTAGEGDTRQFLTDYRRAYRQVLATCALRSQLLRLDTAAIEPEELADAILAALPGTAS